MATLSIPAASNSNVVRHDIATGIATRRGKGVTVAKGVKEVAVHAHEMVSRSTQVGLATTNIVSNELST
jgi:hypothetical protein